MRPSRSEEAIEKAIALIGLSPDKEYKGVVNLGLSINDERVLLDGTKANGQTASEEMIADTALGILLLAEVESSTLTEVPSGSDKKSSWGGGGYKGQTELERLEERWQFFKKQMHPYADDANSIAEFSIRLKSMEASEALIVESALRSLVVLMK